MAERFFSGSQVPQENVTKGVPIIDTAHEAVHLGYGFSAAHYAEGIADNGTLVMTVQTPASGKTIHLKRWKPWGEGGLNTIEIFETPTITVQGTLLTPANRNRYSHSTTAAAAVVRHTPTITVAGTQIEIPVLFGGGGAGGGSGGSDDANEELVLKLKTTYQIKLTNLSGAAKAMGLWLFWYEE